MIKEKLIEFFEKQLNEGKDYIKQCEFDLFYEMKVKQQCKLNFEIINFYVLIIK